ncbi:MAG: ATP-dependent DNA helicase RecG, partial [Micrococcales bacterium]|nr:ATP-dependent DNA helicase RecG [Micrococcales bacterium]
MATLLTPLSRLMEARRAKALRDHRGIDTVEDLLWFLPRRYLDRHGDVTDLTDGAYLVVVGEVLTASVRPMRQRRGSILLATIRTSTGDLDLTFFRPYGHQGKLVPGAVGLFAGRVSRFNGRWQLAHPSYEIFSAGAQAALAGSDDKTEPGIPGFGVRSLYPVYLEVKGLDSWTISGFIATLLPALDGVPDPVPSQLLRARGLPGFVEAMRLIHLPEHRSQVDHGRHRLKYDEALVMQLALGMRRREQRDAVAVPRVPAAGGLLEAFDAALPFELTAGQREVGEQITADLSRPHPMHRLLQGEVGSGKTVIALRAMLAVIDAGGQAALLAPTEVLAAQHQRSMTAMLGDLAEGGMLGGAVQGTRVALLTGSQSAAARKKALLEAASGAAGIVIGTHALIQRHVQLADLGLVVVDEQHRFGVEQRDALRAKAKAAPHVLVMTATPIPRTVAMTVFGDMETSVLAELPPGRSPITSHVIDNPRWYDRCWQRVAEETAAGHQAYVVCPRIGEDDEASGAGGGADSGDEVPMPMPMRAPAGDAGDNDQPEWDQWADQSPTERGDAAPRGQLRGVLEALEELRARPELAGCRVEMLHGRMAPDAKDAVMSAFAAGAVDVLVATTVIEVGVDVSNATVMVVLDADRFGISQLHQLRGRIGRGSAPGLCLFVAQGAQEAGVGEPPPPGALL